MTCEECLGQIWSQSDGLIEGYGMSDQDPKGVNINFSMLTLGAGHYLQAL